MDWLIFWTLLAQLGILGVAGILFSALVKLWTFWWYQPPVERDRIIFEGRPYDD